MLFILQIVDNALRRKYNVFVVKIKQVCCTDAVKPVPTQVFDVLIDNDKGPMFLLAGEYEHNLVK